MAKIILGFAGEMACGKGTAAKYIEEKYQGKSHRFSTMLRDVLDRLHVGHNRESLQTLSRVLRENFGEDILAKVIAHDASHDQSEAIVIDGVRRLADIKYLKELSEFRLIYIEADIRKRYERIIKREENPDDQNKTFEAFEKENQAESELQIRDLRNRADFVIDNNGAMEALHHQVDEIIKKCENLSA